MKYLVFLLLLLFPALAQAQFSCVNHPDLHTQSDGLFAFNDYVRRYIAAGKHLDTELKTIPTVVHVFYDNLIDSLSFERVQSQITAMNQAFRKMNPDTVKTRALFKHLAVDCQIEFCLAGRNPEGQPTAGVVWHKISNFTTDSIADLCITSQWPPAQYLNIWVMPNLENGNSSWPWDEDKSVDGFFVGSRRFGTFGHNLMGGFQEGDLGTHEAGHYLGLLHTFHDGIFYIGQCFPPCDSTGDYVCDTPIDWDFNISAEKCETGLRFCEDGTEFITMQENFMSYSYDTCLNLFTFEQRIRMRATLDSLRRELCSPANLLATGCQQSSGIQNPGEKPERHVRIFPNPVHDQLTVQFLKISTSHGWLRLLAPHGQQVFMENIQTGAAEMNLQLPPLPAGIYFLEINVKEGRFVEKVMVRP